MKRIAVCVLLASLLLGITACGSTARRIDRPRDEVAELHGAPTGFALLGTTHTIKFTSLDGAEFEKSGGATRPDVLDVLPGKHRVGVYYSVKYDGQIGPAGELEAEIDAVAGRTYQAHLLFEKEKGWWVEFREASSEPADAAQKKTETY